MYRNDIGLPDHSFLKSKVLKSGPFLLAICAGQRELLVFGLPSHVDVVSRDEEGIITHLVARNSR